MSTPHVWLVISLVCLSGFARSATPQVTPLAKGLQGAGCAYIDLTMLRLDKDIALTAQQADAVAYGKAKPFLAVEARSLGVDSSPVGSASRIGIDGVEHQLSGSRGSDEYTTETIRVTISDRSVIATTCGSECAGSFVSLTVRVITESGTQSLSALEHCGH